MATLRDAIETQVPGLRIETAQLMEDLIGDLTAVPQPIEIKLFGDDSAVLRRLAPQVAALIEAIPGVVEVFDGITLAGDAVEIRVDRVKAALEGVSSGLVTQQVQDLLAVTVASQIEVGEKMIGVRVWTDESLRNRLELLEQFRLRAPDGHDFPLKRVAHLVISEGQAQLTRENLKPMIAVTARIDGRDLGSTIRDVKERMQTFRLPESVYVEYGGLYQEQQRSFQGLLVVFGSAVLLVVVLLLFLYESYAVVFSILSTTLLSLSGVFAGLWLTGTELNISALMGMTMIVGIVTEVAVFYFAELDLSVSADAAALIRAGTLRMRPILMTSLIAMLALTPLAFGMGAGSAMQKPLAVAIISGLALAVPLVLVLMPVIYSVMAHFLSGSRREPGV
jgi:multidrug efflux pump subunit AcrB